MTGNRLLARNAIWNLLSLVAPMLVALAAIPALIRTLGTDRFGILTLAWMLIGYCSLFDLGLGRALTKLVSEGSEMESAAGLASTVWTALALMLALGCGGALIFAAVSSPLANSVLRVPAGLRAETARSLLWIASAIPLVTLTAGLRGILEARQRFGTLSIVRTVTGLLTFIGPLAAARLWGSLAAVVGVIAAIRLLSLVAHLILCSFQAPDLFSDRRFLLRQAGPLFRFGGWLTVSSLISPLMVSMDRFLVGVLVSVTNVAYYAASYEIASKLKVIPMAVTAVLFPAFSGTLVSNRARARQLYVRGLIAVLVIFTPIAILMLIFARAGLRLWLGEEFAAHGYRALQFLAAGVLINSAADVATVFLHAAGRPDVNAKLHMIEFLLYIPLAFWMIRGYGIEGAAVAWVLRVTVDAALLFYMVERSTPERTSFQWEIVNAGQPATRSSQ